MFEYGRAWFAGCGPGVVRCVPDVVRSDLTSELTFLVDFISNIEKGVVRGCGPGVVRCGPDVVRSDLTKCSMKPLT